MNKNQEKLKEEERQLEGEKINKSGKYPKKFISLLGDSVFKFLFKEEEFRGFYVDVIKQTTGIDLSEYKLTDNEINNGRKTFRDFRLDILLKKNDYDYVSIEMNSVYSTYVLVKNHKYAFKIASFNKKKDKYELTSVTQINFNGWKCSENNEIMKNSFDLYDKENNLTIEGIRIVNVYLPLFKEMWYDGDKSKRYLAMFMAENWMELEKIAGEDEEAKKIVDKLKDLSDDEFFNAIFDKEESYKLSLGSERAEGREEGLVVGREEGLVVGREEERELIVKAMLEKGLDVETISSCTNLEVEEVLKIKEEMNK